ncbi:BRISC complex subunit FAM175B-like [Nilaparvata lugens]|uniref:BRISC complex subunit FAM175B n=1 Tax=Nilaparvata lugens TaxID=108931 RepID=UPI00193D824D|nr:BRISC complex subunit FAM175B [Nilaparvata lugens]XP_039281492.1 BRISC complex subunit FAM175B-like [Nilaparvata lugens]
MSQKTDMQYKISGSALSFLYYECSKSREDQIGFLLGEKHSVITKAISDADVNGEKIETVIDINAVLPVGSPFAICSNVGRVDHKKLREHLGPFEKETYGWYIFRRSSKLSPLFRGSCIHRELLRALPHISSQSFVICCIGSEVSAPSTHTHRHVFFRFRRGAFKPISVPVTNLGHPTEPGYKGVSIGNISNTSFNSIISSLDLGQNTRSVDLLRAVQGPLQQKIQLVAKQVQKSDQKNQRIIEEIRSLKVKRLLAEKIKSLGDHSRNSSTPEKVLKNGNCSYENRERNAVSTPPNQRATVQECLINSQSDEELSPATLKSQMSDRIIEDSSSIEY